MKVNDLIIQLEKLNVNFYTGVPDSQLEPLCSYLINNYGITDHHIIAANEGNAVGLAAGFYMATKKIPCVYMQNSGLGNTVNPIASLLNDRVYAIPTVFIIGWRGEPGIKDEPQHDFQGMITLKLLQDLDITYFVLEKTTTNEDVEQAVSKFKTVLKVGKSVAFVVKKASLVYDEKVSYINKFSIKREDAIKRIIEHSGEDIIVSTTGKTSRELFEVRENNGQSHKYDFLTVGSMGHSSSIALGIALNTGIKVWCLDGDGAVLMHMGAVALIGSKSPANFIHVVFNNSSHESVGGMPTVSDNIDIKTIALACGYKKAFSVTCLKELDIILEELRKLNELCLLEIKVAIGSRVDLGRPTTTPIENKDRFMQFIENSQNEIMKRKGEN